MVAKTESSSVLPFQSEALRAEETSVTVEGQTTAPSQPILSEETQKILAEAQALGLKPWMVRFQRNLPELPADPLSNAKPKDAVTTHLVWDVEPDFGNKQLKATATYNYLNKAEGNDQLVLDVSNLDIQEILINGEQAEFHIEKSQSPQKPDALMVSIPADQRNGVVSIRYTTSPGASGTYWIDKEYTNGKELPLLYTIFETVEGASVIPGQHTPQVRLTYEVNGKTNSPDLMMLSSVNNNPTARSEDGIYSGLKMGRSVPLYLLSLHVGNFDFQRYDEDARTGVYAEDTMIEDVAKSFAMLPQYLKAAEKICGPYNWGTYTPILLPWAFPYMAMEHPCASTCGQICMEQPAVIAHELAHSWTGNDITNCNWKQFFWNEGATCFTEYLICKEVYGADRAATNLMNLLEETRASMDEFRETNPDLMRLCQETDTFEFSRIPYGKGALFFFVLQEAMGEKFDCFFQDYMKVFYANTMSDDRFLSFLKLWVKNEMGIEDFSAFKEEHKVDEWLYGTEIPSNAPKFTSKFADVFAVEKQKVFNKEPIEIEQFTQWDTALQSSFLSSLTVGVTREHLEVLDGQLGLTQSKTMSIREEWSRLCAITGYITPETTAMISDYVIERNSVHRANQISTPLSKTEEGREVIRAILDKGEKKLFPVTVKTLKEKL